MISSRTPALLFCLLLTVIAAPLLLRAWAIRPLFFDAAVRSQTQVALSQVAQSRGWILSDISLRSVTADSLTLVHREHLRVPSDAVCLMVKLSTFAVSPCES